METKSYNKTVKTGQSLKSKEITLLLSLPQIIKVIIMGNIYVRICFREI